MVLEALGARVCNGIEAGLSSCSLMYPGSILAGNSLGCQHEQARLLIDAS
jgi:hypothetical protein